MDLDVSAERFVEFGKERLFDIADESTAKDIATEIVTKRRSLRSSFEKSALANALLPSFRSLSSEIDLRVRFDDRGDLANSASVAIVSISTDTDDEIWFQGDKNDITRLIDALQKAVANLDLADRLKVKRGS